MKAACVLVGWMIGLPTTYAHEAAWHVEQVGHPSATQFVLCQGADCSKRSIKHWDDVNDKPVAKLLPEVLDMPEGVVKPAKQRSPAKKAPRNRQKHKAAGPMVWHQAPMKR